MTDYFTFRTRQGHKAISFDDSSVILTEKTAELLGLAVGDPFEVELSDGSRQTLTLTGITENYVFTRLYLSQTQLKRLTGGTLPAVSCKTRSDIPKEKIFDVVRALKSVVVPAPVHIGQILLPDAAGTGVDVVATKDVAEV